MNEEAPYKLSISLHVLEQLGINLYSNVPSVLAEIIANSWDADAAKVTVDWNDDYTEMVIQDNGVGMTREDINDRFLTVGYRRRDAQPGLTQKGRKPMGRKGIGKLSVFSIANRVIVESSKDGEKNALEMELSEIREAIQTRDQDAIYYPKALSGDGIDFDCGTRITLQHLKKRQTSSTVSGLKKRVARRFSILGAQNDFRVSINGAVITPADRAYWDSIQFLWLFGDSNDVEKLCSNATVINSKSIRSNNDSPVNGWIGTVFKSNSLRDDDKENLNQIALTVRGKMAQSDLLRSMSERGVYASYLIGELSFDDLDRFDGDNEDRDDDAATSSRQQIVEDDPRYRELMNLLQPELTAIGNKWAQLRVEEGTQEALNIPEIAEWIDSLEAAARPAAKRWLGKLGKLGVDDDRVKRQLLKHAVIGFEFFRARENLEALDSISDSDIESALQVFKELDNIEEVLYGQIVRQRLEVIETLEKMVDANDLERSIQRFIFDRLWLLDPSWERAEDTATIETRVDRLFNEIDTELTDEVRQSRIDIRYRKVSGQHVIIELKRPDRINSVFDLAAQVRKYRSGLMNLLSYLNREHEPFEFVLILGRRPRESSDPDGDKVVRDTLSSVNARVLYYETLLEDAKRVYSEYLETRQSITKLEKVIAAIDNFGDIVD